MARPRRRKVMYVIERPGYWWVRGKYKGWVDGPAPGSMNVRTYYNKRQAFKMLDKCPAGTMCTQLICNKKGWWERWTATNL